MLQEGRPVAQVRPQGSHLGIGTERGPQQAQAVQLLNPLAIEHVALAARHMLEMPTVDQIDFQAARFQQLKDRNPIHTGGFQRNRVDATDD